MSTVSLVRHDTQLADSDLLESLIQRTRTETMNLQSYGKWSEISQHKNALFYAFFFL